MSPEFQSMLISQGYQPLFSAIWKDTAGHTYYTNPTACVDFSKSNLQLLASNPINYVFVSGCFQYVPSDILCWQAEFNCDIDPAPCNQGVWTLDSNSMQYYPGCLPST